MVMRGVGMVVVVMVVVVVVVLWVAAVFSYLSTTRPPQRIYV